MSRSPVEAEARGDEFVAATFGGTTFQVPLDVDAWPLDAIRDCRGLTAQGHLAVDHGKMIVAIRALLGEDQWRKFLRTAPRRRDHIPASHAFAEAVGIPRTLDDADVAFGAIPRLLLLLETWPDKVESDLRQFWRLDYRNRWRRGLRKLTLRQIHACLSNLPTTSALAIAINGGTLPKTGAELVLMDLFEASTGRRHPSRPMSPEERLQRDAQAAADHRAREAHHARMSKRERQQSAGVENARANARRAQEREEAHAQEAADSSTG